jgi:hypothetical protein
VSTSGNAAVDALDVKVCIEKSHVPYTYFEFSVEYGFENRRDGFAAERGFEGKAQSFRNCSLQQALTLMPCSTIRLCCRDSGILGLDLQRRFIRIEELGARFKERGSSQTAFACSVRSSKNVNARRVA